MYIYNLIWTIQVNWDYIGDFIREHMVLTILDYIYIDSDCFILDDSSTLAGRHIDSKKKDRKLI